MVARICARGLIRLQSGKKSPVGVGPGARHTIEEPGADRVARGRMGSHPVLADVRFDGGLAVAKDVVGADRAVARCL